MQVWKIGKQTIFDFGPWKFKKLINYCRVPGWNRLNPGVACVGEVRGEDTVEQQWYKFLTDNVRYQSHKRSFTYKRFNNSFTNIVWSLLQTKLLATRSARSVARGAETDCRPVELKRYSGSVSTPRVRYRGAAEERMTGRFHQPSGATG